MGNFSPYSYYGHHGYSYPQHHDHEPQRKVVPANVAGDVEVVLNSSKSLADRMASMRKVAQVLGQNPVPGDCIDEFAAKLRDLFVF